ncbi:hypothetical protein [Desulfovibrio legallii]|uniref:Uncharacterized protein n=1 Tax=Desulfovibrio legallii TaxID=571438 RepID=A0A1G7R2H6_9BACT|nr:hypothetical protein [Desulfovibrio legallii]SDG04986.1 hypothetical protein SAMN05192586_1276 [Desulfovibrio legallii]
MKHILLYIAIIFKILAAQPVAAEEDIFADYNKDMSKPADANVMGVYDAWGNNMAHRIKNGYSDGVVIDGPGSYADGAVRADGLGNVVIDKNANVGPVINQTDINNSTVIIQQKKKF